LVTGWIQLVNAFGTIAIAALGIATLISSERFRRWTTSLRSPTPILVEAWVEKRESPLQFFLHLGFTNPGEAPIFITRVAAKLSISPFNLSSSNEYLKVEQQGLIKPFDASTLILELSNDNPDFLEMLIDRLEPREKGVAIEFVAGSRKGVLSWRLPDMQTSDERANWELLPAMEKVSPDRFGWLPWHKGETGLHVGS